VFISRDGMVQRTAVRGINRYGRLSQGVKVMNVRDDDVVSAVAVVYDSDDEDETTVDPLELALEGEVPGQPGEAGTEGDTPAETDDDGSPGTQINESDIDDAEDEASPTTEDDVT
jgi:DNA gyrase subunit A